MQVGLRQLHGRTAELLVETESDSDPVVRPGTVRDGPLLPCQREAEDEPPQDQNVDARVDVGRGAPEDKAGSST